MARQAAGKRSVGLAMPDDIYELLSRVAFARRMDSKPNASLSAIVCDCVERSRARLEKELAVTKKEGN